MPTPYSRAEWDRIRSHLAADPDRYGFPGFVPGSVLIGSFNIRKLGGISRGDEATWAFLAESCRPFDLLAVQEVQDSLEGLHKLHRAMGEGEFDLIVSDKTGAHPESDATGERLAFIYRRSTVRHREVSSDISIDRTHVLDTLLEHHEDFHENLTDRLAALAEWEREAAAADANGTKRPDKPPFKLSHFLAFIRTPYCAAFEIPGSDTARPYQFMAVNAHLYFGHYIGDRRQEFDALMSWLRARAAEDANTLFDDFILLGDLNLDFNNPTTDRARIEAHMKTFNARSGESVHVNFPFLDAHRGASMPFRTNARASETFDHIGLLAHDPRLPGFELNEQMPIAPEGPDYGCFDFVQLFIDALGLRQRSTLTTRARRDAFYGRFEHTVSDHLPIWMRLPLPR